MTAKWLWFYISAIDGTEAIVSWGSSAPVALIFAALSCLFWREGWKTHDKGQEVEQ